jgi:hypothetical protein
MKKIEFVADHMFMDTFTRSLSDCGLMLNTHFQTIYFQNVLKYKIITTCREQDLSNTFLQINTLIQASGGICETFGIHRPSPL